MAFDPLFGLWTVTVTPNKFHLPICLLTGNLQAFPTHTPRHPHDPVVLSSRKT